MIQLVHDSHPARSGVSPPLLSITRCAALFLSLVLTLPSRLSPSLQINTACLQFQVFIATQYHLSSPENSKINNALPVIDKYYE